MPKENEFISGVLNRGITITVCVKVQSADLNGSPVCS